MKKYFLFALIAALTVVSCKKPSDDTSTPTPGTSKVLKRFIETKAGQSTTYNVSYDGSKRLTAVSSSDNQEVMTFTYGANDNIAKIENKEGNDRDVFEISYSNGVPSSATYKSYEKDGANETLISQYSLQYTVENNLVTKIKMIVPPDPAAGEDGYELDYDLSYTNGNLTRVETQGAFAYAAIFSYGTKKPVFPAIFKYVLDPAGFSLEFFAKNDLLSMTYDYPGTELDVTINNTYTYDSKGYVLTSDDGETQTRFEYE
jgi:hypothetical protein